LATEAFTIGVEEELLLVEPDTYALSHTSSALIETMGEDELCARQDLYEAQVELSSRPQGRAADAVSALGRMRRSVLRAGWTPMGAGIHPAAELGDVRVVQKERYTRAAAYLGGVVRRTPDSALHVHVGMPDPDTAVRACNGLRERLPLLHALAANSPFWHGQDARLASARFVLRRGFPRVEVPRAFRDFEEFERSIASTLEAAGADDYTSLWWDVRPHPKLGTVEVRVMDAQSSLRNVAGLAALVHGLAIHEALSTRREWMEREPIEESLFAATSQGLGARLLSEGGLRPVPELAREAVALASTHLADAGLGSDELEEVERIVTDGGGADRQRMAFDSGGIREVQAFLVAETGAVE
jgi:glutamate---cysteine ligase / carboxylate-amine ligase